MKEILLRAVKRLPEQERVATILFYMGEYSHAEIVEFLSIPLSTVNNRLRTARRHLKERLVKNMVCQTLSQQQPSRNDKFVKEVLFKAIEQVAPERVSEIFNENPMLINATDSKGRTPIEALTSQRSFGWNREGQTSTQITVKRWLAHRTCQCGSGLWLTAQTLTPATRCR